MSQIKRVESILNRIDCKIFNIPFHIKVYEDRLFKNEEGHGRLYIQVSYFAQCNKTKRFQLWKGRKWYLSNYMLEDEIIKTAWVAYESAVKHEVMETFKVDGKILFNPHTSFEDLLSVTHKEVKR